jgi:hypothetical protein
MLGPPDNHHVAVHLTYSPTLTSNFPRTFARTVARDPAQSVNNGETLALCIGLAEVPAQDLSV